MASFQAKTGRERLRKRNFFFFAPISSYPTRNREFQNNSKKIKKHHYGFFSSQNGMGLSVKEKKKLSFRSVTTRPGIKNSKKITKKIQASKKHH